MYAEHYYAQCVNTLQVTANFLVIFNTNQTLMFGSSARHSEIFFT